MAHCICDKQQPQINYLEKQLEITRRELNNLRQQLKSLNFIFKKECNKITEKLETFRCVDCQNKEKLQVDNVKNDVAYPSTDILLKQVGIVNTDFPEKRGTPRQAIICSDATAKLTLNNEVFTNPHHSLDGLKEFSHMWVLYHFHKTDAAHIRAKISPPRLNGIKTGVFATRSPHRPSPIGLSLVKINKIAGSAVYFSGVDMIDGTPVLDIKPYIPHYDNPDVLNFLKSNNTNELGSNGSHLPHSSGILDSSVALNSTAEHARFTAENVEREMPDGEEGEPSDSNVTMNPTCVENSEGCVKIPSWINDSPVTTLHVTFKERALAQLYQLGPEGDAKKNIIMNVLREDPRSIYLREKLGNQFYVFKISEFHVSCKFNDLDHVVTVHQVCPIAGSVTS